MKPGLCRDLGHGHRCQRRRPVAEEGALARDDLADHLPQGRTADRQRLFQRPRPGQRRPRLGAGAARHTGDGDILLQGRQEFDLPAIACGGQPDIGFTHQRRIDGKATARLGIELPQLREAGLHHLCRQPGGRHQPCRAAGFEHRKMGQHQPHGRAHPVALFELKPQTFLQVAREQSRRLDPFLNQPQRRGDQILSQPQPLGNLVDPASEPARGLQLGDQRGDHPGHQPALPDQPGKLAENVIIKTVGLRHRRHFKHIGGPGRQRSRPQHQHRVVACRLGQMGVKFGRRHLQQPHHLSQPEHLALPCAQVQTRPHVPASRQNTGPALFGPAILCERTSGTAAR